MNDAKNLKQVSYNLQHDDGLSWGADSQEDVRNDQLRLAVTNVILELGVPANIRGYLYLREAIIIKMDSPNHMISMTKALYPGIAGMFQTSAPRVERAIRHAIKVAWERGDLSMRQKIFCHAAANPEWRPTNSEFIATIVDRLELSSHAEN